MRGFASSRDKTIASAIRDAAARLAPVSDTPRLDAELLMAHALGMSREAMLLGHMADSGPSDFAALVARRERHEPLAYITGRRDFWTIALDVRPGVLIPRPDSETLIEAAVAHFGAAGPRRILDLGTGSGALLLAALAEWPSATGVGVDRSDIALAVTGANADRLGLGQRTTLRKGDWGDGIDEAFDLVLCNPPYIEQAAPLPPDVADFEPAEALFAGADGLDDYRRLAPQLPRLIARGGMAAVEIGADQADAVQNIFANHALMAKVRKDLAGRDRCIVATH
jgi:release factor glutamine methyltransferase